MSAASSSSSPPPSSSLPAPSSRGLATLCLRLELAGVLVGATGAEQRRLLAANGWSVERSVQAAFAAAANSEDEDEEEERSDGGSSERGECIDVDGEGDGGSAAAAPAPVPTPPLVAIRVLSDSGDDMTYNSYKSGRPLAKLLDNFATGVARRRLDFFFRGRPVCGDDTPAALQMPAHAQLDARAPARVKRSFQLGAGVQGALASAAAAGPAVTASANGSDSSSSSSSGSGSPSAPPFKRAKSDPLSSPPASSAAAVAAASSVGASAAEAAASSSPPVAYIAPWSELQLGTCEFVVRQQTRSPLDDKGTLSARPPQLVTLSSFVREYNLNQWAACLPPHRRDAAEGASAAAAAAASSCGDDDAESAAAAGADEHYRADRRNSRLVSLLKPLAGLSRAIKASVRLIRSDSECQCGLSTKECPASGITFHTMRLSVSLLPGAHDAIIPQANFLLPLLAPEFAELVRRELPERRAPPTIRHLSSILDISLRTKFVVRDEEQAADPALQAAPAPMLMEVEDEEENEGEEEQKESSASRGAGVPSEGVKHEDAAAAPVRSEAEQMRAEWGLSAEVEDDLWCPQTAPLLRLSEQQLSQRAGLNITLRDYQQQSVLWALKQECSESMAAPYWSRIQIGPQSVWYSAVMQALRFEPPPPVTGGMICEEMGLGKTMEILALIHLNPASAPVAAAASSSSAVAPNLSRLASTPLPSLSLSAPPAEPAPLPSKCTLIIAPTSLVGQWFNEISSRSAVHSRLKVLCWYGNRTSALERIMDYDVVLTTFGIIHAEQAKTAKSAGGYVSPLQRIEWHRIVVDESHQLKGKNTRQSQSVVTLHSRRRWLLSGTPLNTQIDDLFHQFAFFRMPVLHSSQLLSAVRRHCFARSGESGSLDDFSPRECFGLLERMLTRTIMRHRKDQSFNGRSSLIELPPRTSDVIKVHFTPTERAAYDKMFEFAKLRFGELAARGSVVAQTFCIMSLLSPLRQACSAGKQDLNALLEKLRAVAAAVEESATASAAASAAAKLVQSQLDEAQHAFNDDGECSICLDVMEDALMTLCKHAFCRDCIYKVCPGRGQYECPLCRSPVLRKDLVAPKPRPAPVAEPPAEESKEDEEAKANGSSSAAAAAAVDVALPDQIAFSSKVDALLTQLRRLRVENAATKSLVFTSFAATIDVICERLAHSGFDAAVIKGSMTMTQRKSALERFVSDPSCNVLVLSLRSGAVGLTLTAATEVFLMEPALNPALTQQAVDRVHRVGQTRPVHVHHLIMADSIEERIMGLTPQLQPQESLEAAAAAAAAATAALGAGRSSRAGPLTKDTRSMRAAELTALFS